MKEKDRDEDEEAMIRLSFRESGWCVILVVVK